MAGMAHTPVRAPATAQVTEALGLANIKDRQWSIQETAAVKGEGLFDGFDWCASR